MSEAPGFHHGRHFNEWVDDVSDLRRSEQLDEALTLLSHLIDATEAEARPIAGASRRGTTNRTPSVIEN